MKKDKLILINLKKENSQLANLLNDEKEKNRKQNN